jgi:hypothetical protein
MVNSHEARIPLAEKTIAGEGVKRISVACTRFGFLCQYMNYVKLDASFFFYSSISQFFIESFCKTYYSNPEF